jgi:imidazolonepropionase-like amidohydrolase
VETYDEALSAVDGHKKLGVVVLKEYNTPTRTQQQWLYQAAKTRGLGIVSHVESLEGMMTRVVDGYTGGEHATIPIPFYDDVHELLRRTGFIWTPNISIESGAIGVAQDADAFYWQEVRKEGPAKLDKLKSLASPDRYPETDPAVPSVPFNVHRMSRVAEQAANAALGGVHIGVSGHSMPGANLHKEMWYLWRGGMPAQSVLRAATLGNAEKLGISEDVGTLANGKIADIVVFDENPLRDILNTMSIRYTIQQGIIYDSDTAETLHPEEMEGFMPQAGAGHAKLAGTTSRSCRMKAVTSAPTYGN